jgi:hypothetical protein
MALERSNIKNLREADADSQDANMRSRRYSGDAYMQSTQQSVRYVLPLSIYSGCRWVVGVRALLQARYRYGGRYAHTLRTTQLRSVVTVAPSLPKHHKMSPRIAGPWPRHARGPGSTGGRWERRVDGKRARREAKRD